MSTEPATSDVLCHSNGPRIGGEGTPFCVLPKMHKGNHVPDESWFGTINYWSDHAFAGVPNADLRNASERHADVGVSHADRAAITTPEQRAEWARREAIAVVRAAQSAEWLLADDDPAAPFVELAIHAMANARHLAADGAAFTMPYPELAVAVENRR